MSVTAHLTEMYVSKYKYKPFNFRWLLMGCYFPDGMGMSKLLLLVTGNPLFHRDILFGWTHSLPVCALFGAAIWSIFGKRAALSFTFAAWLHTIMDLGDPIGVKMFYPFLDHKLSLGIWPWTDQSILSDMATYYTTPTSALIELGLLIAAIYAYKKITGSWNPVTATLKMWKAETWSDNSVATQPAKAVA